MLDIILDIFLFILNVLILIWLFFAAKTLTSLLIVGLIITLFNLFFHSTFYSLKKKYYDR